MIAQNTDKKYKDLLKESPFNSMYPKFMACSRSINKQIDKQINWLNESIKEELELEFYKNPEIKNEIKKIKNNIITSNLNIKKTARKLVKKFLK